VVYFVFHSLSLFLVQFIVYNLLSLVLLLLSLWFYIPFLISGFILVFVIIWWQIWILRPRFTRTTISQLLPIIILNHIYILSYFALNAYSWPELSPDRYDINVIAGCGAELGTVPIIDHIVIYISVLWLIIDMIYMSPPGGGMCHISLHISILSPFISYVELTRSYLISYCMSLWYYSVIICIIDMLCIVLILLNAYVLTCISMLCIIYYCLSHLLYTVSLAMIIIITPYVHLYVYWCISSCYIYIWCIYHIVNI
jgi:hypothetical protein